MTNDNFISVPCAVHWLVNNANYREQPAKFVDMVSGKEAAAALVKRFRAEGHCAWYVTLPE